METSSQILDLAALLKDYRKKSKISIRTLADLSFMSYQLVSKYETRTARLSFDTFLDISKHLNIDLEKIVYIQNHLAKDLNRLHDSLVFLYKDEAIQLHQRIESVQEYIIYSNLQLNWKVVDFLFDFNFPSHKNSPEFDFSFSDDIENEQPNAIVFEAVALSRLMVKDLIEANKAIQKALSSNPKQSIIGLLNYHSGYILLRLGRLNSAMQYSLYAEQEFIKTHNLNRLVQVQYNIATIYARMGLLDKAMERYLRLYHNATNNNDLKLEHNSLYYIAWLEFLNGDYIKSLNTVDLIDKKFKLLADGYYIRALNFIEMNENEDALSAIFHGLSRPLNASVALKLGILKIYIEKGNSASYMNELLRVLSIAKKDNDVDTIEFALDHLEIYYEKFHLYKMQGQILKEKLAFAMTKLQ